MRILAVAFLALLASESIASAQSFEERFSIIPRAEAAPAPEENKKVEPQPQTQPEARQVENEALAKDAFSGMASFYSYKNANTASGTKFDRDQPTAAHRTLPFGTRLRVTNVENNKSVIVTVTDRGPHTRGRVIDLSLKAAQTIGITQRGVVEVRAEVL